MSRARVQTMDNKDLLKEQIYKRTRANELIWQRAKALGISRRRLVQLLAAGTSAVGVGLIPSRRSKKVVQAQVIDNTFTQTEKTPPIIKEIRPDWFFQVKTNLEMRWENMYNRGYLVTNNLFFVRNNNPTPRIDPANYQLEILGDGVSNPRSFSYDEILSMSSISVIKAIECAGNGRSFYQTAYGQEASGTQWKLGGIGLDINVYSTKRPSISKVFLLKMNLALSYFSRRLPSKYLRRGNVSLSSSGWNRSGTIALVAPGIPA